MASRTVSCQNCILAAETMPLSYTSPWTVEHYNASVIIIIIKSISNEDKEQLVTMCQLRQSGQYNVLLVKMRRSCIVTVLSRKGYSHNLKKSVIWWCRLILLCILYINFQLLHRFAQMTDIFLQIVFRHYMIILHTQKLQNLQSIILKIWNCNKKLGSGLFHRLLTSLPTLWIQHAASMINKHYKTKCSVRHVYSFIHKLSSWSSCKLTGLASCCLLNMQQLVGKVHDIGIMFLSCHRQKMHQRLLVVVSFCVCNLDQVRQHDEFTTKFEITKQQACMNANNI